jgi:hypothetical protein
MKFTPHPCRHQRRPKYNDYRDFKHLAEIALRQADIILRLLLPAGRVEGHEYVALNPRRVDHHLGSFRVNLRNGKWADFATGDRGGDLISLAAYVRGTTQGEAATFLSHATLTGRAV